MILNFVLLLKLLSTQNNHTQHELEILAYLFEVLLLYQAGGNIR